MSKYKVDISGIDTNNLEVLSPDEMQALFKVVKEDKAARELLVQGNLKLVLSILRKMNKNNENLDDLFQIGCVGLLKAIDNFDLKYEVKFSTYAVPMILGEIKRYIRDNNSIRVSRSVKDLAYRIVKEKEDYYIQNGKEIEIDELSKKINASEYEISNALESLKEPVSIFEPIYNDGGDSILLCDQIEDKKSNTIDFSNRLALERAVSELEDRENYILNQRYIYGKTQMEIADELSISQAQVSRLEKSAIKTLQKVLK